jgi:hypothetical protein
MLFAMGFDQYHETADELSQETRTFARMIAGLTEEAEAINWYEPRMSVEKDKDAITVAPVEVFRQANPTLPSRRTYSIGPCCRS